MKAFIWRERHEGHVVAVEIAAGVVARAMLICEDDDMEGIALYGIPDGADDPDLAEMVEANQDEFDWIGID